MPPGKPPRKAVASASGASASKLSVTSNAAQPFGAIGAPANAPVVLGPSAATTRGNKRKLSVISAQALLFRINYLDNPLELTGLTPLEFFNMSVFVVFMNIHCVHCGDFACLFERCMCRARSESGVVSVHVAYGIP